MRKKVQSVLVVVNSQSSSPTQQAVEQIRSILEAKKIQSLWKETSRVNSMRSLCEWKVNTAKVDLVIVVGGDGTLLQVAHQVMHTGIPLLGINLGKLGFLTSLRPEEILKKLPVILSGKYKTTRRMALQFQVSRKGKIVQSGWALNDVVVSRGRHSHMVRLGLEISNQLVCEYYCDGIIASTPTGSTAYSLSAGGPIISPNAHVFGITPICAHTLSNRPLIISADEPIRITLPHHSPSILLQADGVSCCNLKQDDTIDLTVAPNSPLLAHLTDVDFYAITRQKLKWSGSSL